MAKKITFVGAGNVGSQAAFLAAAKGLGDIVLVDIVEGVVKGKALDLAQSTPLLGKAVSIIGTTDYVQTAHSDIVVITAGVPRKPGMTREDLYTINAKIVTEVVQQIVKHSPDCILIVVTNPLDRMVQLAYETSGFSRERVIGMAGGLDTARFKAFLAAALHVSVTEITAYVLGSHGDTMVPVVSQATAKGKPITALLTTKHVQQIVEQTQHAGAEIVSLLNTSAYYAPGAAIIEIVEAILLDQKKIIPCHAYLQGEYGVKGKCLGVPCRIGKKGIEEIVKLPLSAEEQRHLLAEAP